MEDNRRPEPDEIRRASGAGANAGDSHGATDTTQTFGHDSDLSFVPFGSDLNDAELDAIEALPTRAALFIVRSGPTAGARYLLDTDVTTVGRHPEADIFFDDVTVSRRHAEITRTGSLVRARRPALAQRHLRQRRARRPRGAHERLRGARRQVPPELLRLARRPAAGGGRLMPASSARERSSSAGLLSIGQVLARLSPEFPNSDLQQAALPRGAGHRHAHPHRLGLPQVLAGRPRATATRAHAAARSLPAARRHPRVPRRRRRRPRPGAADRRAAAVDRSGPAPLPPRGAARRRRRRSAAAQRRDQHRSARRRRTRTTTRRSRSCGHSSPSTATASSRDTCARSVRAPSATSRWSSRRSRPCCDGRMPHPAPVRASSRPSWPSASTRCARSSCAPRSTACSPDARSATHPRHAGPADADVVARRPGLI